MHSEDLFSFGRAPHEAIDCIIRVRSVTVSSFVCFLRVGLYAAIFLCLSFYPEA